MHLLFTLLEKYDGSERAGYLKLIEIYGDTDSLFFKLLDMLTGKSLPFGDRLFEEGRSVAKFGTDLFNGTIKLEFEKLYRILLMKGPKNYAGDEVNADHPDLHELIVKGIKIKKAGTCKLVQELGFSVLEKVCMLRSVENAILSVQEAIKKIHNGTMPFDWYISRQTLNKDPSDYKQQNLPQLVIANLRAKRSGRNIHSGEPVSWVVTTFNRSEKSGKGDFRKNLVCDRVEDPLYAFQQRYPIDVAYYEETIIKSVLPLLKLCFNGDENLAKAAIYSGLSGKNLLRKKSSIRKDAPLQRFVVVKEKCLLCKGVVDRGKRPRFCETCRNQSSASTQKFEAHLLTDVDHGCVNKIQAYVEETEKQLKKACLTSTLMRENCRRCLKNDDIEICQSQTCSYMIPRKEAFRNEATLRIIFDDASAETTAHSVVQSVEKSINLKKDFERLWKQLGKS